MNQAVKRFLLFRLLPSVLIIYGGVKVLNYGLGSGDPISPFAGLLIMMGCIVLVAVIHSGMIARLMAKIILPLFYPSVHDDHPMPIYSIPCGKRKMGLHDEAMMEYEKIILEHPLEHQPYLDMMEIAAVDMRSPELLEAIYERGMLALKNKDQRANLTRFHRVMKEWNRKLV